MCCDLFSYVQALGLQHSYTEDEGPYKYLQKFMALPFLPEDEILLIFNCLERQASTAKLQNFVRFVSETWINGSTWPQSSWSVFKEAVQTNNDIKGWRNTLNRRASGKSQVPFYLMIHILHNEERLTSFHIRLISEKKMKRIQRKKHCSMQAQVFTLWQEYENGERSAKLLLRTCSHLNGPI